MYLRNMLDETIKSQVSFLVTKLLLSSEVFMVLKVFLIFSQAEVLIFQNSY